MDLAGSGQSPGSYSRSTPTEPIRARAYLRGSTHFGARSSTLAIPPCGDGDGDPHEWGRGEARKCDVVPGSTPYERRARASPSATARVAVGGSSFEVRPRKTAFSEGHRPRLLSETVGCRLTWDRTMNPIRGRSTPTSSGTGAPSRRSRAAVAPRPWAARRKYFDTATTSQSRTDLDPRLLSRSRCDRRSQRTRAALGEGTAVISYVRVRLTRVRPAPSHTLRRAFATRRNDWR